MVEVLRRPGIWLGCLLMLGLPPIAAWPKKPAPNVEPVVYRGVRYVAPNDDGTRAYVAAFDDRTGEQLWEVTVFRTEIITPWPHAETDIQFVFITGMRIDDGALVVVGERNRAFRVNLKTHAVTELPAGTPMPTLTPGYTPLPAEKLRAIPD